MKVDKAIPKKICSAKFKGLVPIRGYRYMKLNYWSTKKYRLMVSLSILVTVIGVSNSKFFPPQKAIIMYIRLKEYMRLVMDNKNFFLQVLVIAILIFLLTALLVIKFFDML